MKLFVKNKKQFDRQSNAQLVKALIAGQQATFDYVFDEYQPLLQSIIKSAFHSKEVGKEEYTQRCGELQTFLTENDCAKLKLYNQEDSGFEEWLAKVSLSFFKKRFRDDNIALVEKYIEGDRTVVYERFQSNCEQLIKRTRGWENDYNGGSARVLLDDLHKYMLKDNCKELNTYKPDLQTFDAWFKTVMHNFWIDSLRADNENKFEKKVLESGGFVRIDDEDTCFGWDKLILVIDDKDKIELIQKIRKTLNTLEPPRYRDILIDLFYKGKKYDEIAESYQVTKANAYNIVSRALDRMKTKIEKEYGLRTKR